MSSVEELAHAIAGAGGGALSMIVTYPLVTILTLAQTEKKDKDSDNKQFKENVVKKVIFNTLKKKGILGFYSGLESALYGITLTNFIYYYFYEYVSNVFLRRNGKSTRGLSTTQSIIAGAIAGAITCIGSNPLWVVNTRMMRSEKFVEEKNNEIEKKIAKSLKSADLNAAVGNTSSINSIPKKISSPSALSTLISIIKNDGFMTLFAGVLPALVLVINPIIQYTIFEQFKNFIITTRGKSAFKSYHIFLLGAFGKLIATTLTYPYITLKARMHLVKKTKNLKHESNLSMIGQIKLIIKNEGIEGLYSGLSIKLLQSISTAAFLFYFKEELLVGSVKLVELTKALKQRK